MLFVQTIRRILQNANDEIPFDAAIQRDLVSTSKSTSIEIHEAAQRDTLILLDDMVATLLNSTDNNENIKAAKQHYKMCDTLIDSNPTSILLESDSLKLRLHVMRLMLFNLIASSYGPDQNLLSLYKELEKPADRERRTAIDISLEALRESSKVPSLRDLKYQYIDTILMDYEKLYYVVNLKVLPWTHETVRTMVLEQASQSEDFIDGLVKLHELSADDLVNSIKVRITSIPQYIVLGDRKQLVRVVALCERDITRLTQGRNLILTPVRTPPISFYEKGAIPLFVEDLNSIKRENHITVKELENVEHEIGIK